MDQNDTCMDVDANASIVTDAVSHDNDTGVSVNITDTSVRDPNGANNIAVEVRSQPNAVDVNIPLESNVVNGDSYASRAARTDGSAFGFRQMPRPSTPRVNNDMPKRPRSALFTPSRSTSARSVFAALSAANIGASDIQCLQRKMNGEVVITFKSDALKEKFLTLNAISIDSESYAIQDIDRPLTFLTIYDAPFELSDWAIIRRLTPFCEVVNFRRGKFEFDCAPNVYNGLRHYRVRVLKPIPNFLRFGRYQVFLKYAGQPLTCRKCNLPGHFSYACDNKVCFNCERIGHEANFCPAPPLCNFCKHDGHLSRDCTYSWVSPTVRGEHTDETAQVIVDDNDDAGSGFETRSDDSFQWAEDSDLSDEYVDGVEELPLAAALPSHLQPSSEVPAEQLSPEASADPPAVSPPSATSAELPAASADPPTTATDVSPSPEDSSVLPSTSDAPAAETQVLFQSSASPPDAQPVPSTPDVPPSVPSSTQSDHVLDSGGLVIVDNRPPPPPARPLRPSRRHPAPLPEALAAAARRKPTTPSLVSGRPRPAAASPMDVSSELKRKAAQTAAREKDKKKKGRK